MNIGISQTWYPSPTLLKICPPKCGCWPHQPIPVQKPKTLLPSCQYHRESRASQGRFRNRRTRSQQNLKRVWCGFSQQCLTGWCFGIWILWLSIQLGMSSSQLTKSYFYIFFRGVGIPPTIWRLLIETWFNSFLVNSRKINNTCNLQRNMKYYYTWCANMCNIYII